MAKNRAWHKAYRPGDGPKILRSEQGSDCFAYTGVSYPRSYFQSGPIAVLEEEEEVEQKELDVEEEGPVLVPLEEADEDAKAAGDELPEIEDDVEVDLGDEDDTFLAEEEEEDDDVADIIGVGEDDDEI